MFDHRAAVGVGRVALAGIGGVALNDGAVYGLDHRLPELGRQKVLVARFAGVNLDGDLTGQLETHGLVELHDLLRRDLLGKINLCFHILILLRWIVYCLGRI